MRPVHGLNKFPGLQYDVVSYGSLNTFIIAGRDARIDYPAGTVVIEPVTGKLAAVIDRAYATNTTVMLSDGICFPGMTVIARAARQTRQIPPSEISASLVDSTYEGRNAAYSFDLNYSSGDWISYLYGANTVGSAYIGNTFTSAKKVCGFLIVHNNYNEPAVPAVNVQYADGWGWTTHANATFTVGSSLSMCFFPPPSSGHTQWRLIVSTAHGNFWQVRELNWFE